MVVLPEGEEILDVAQQFGARPIRRPDEIAGDTATSESAWGHALDTIEADGIQVDLVIGMQATNQDWRDNVTSKFYIQLPDGRYGRIDFYLLAYNGAFTVHSTVNPSGSRRLEQ